MMVPEASAANGPPVWEACRRFDRSAGQAARRHGWASMYLARSLLDRVVTTSPLKRVGSTAVPVHLCCGRWSVQEIERRAGTMRQGRTFAVLAGEKVRAVVPRSRQLQRGEGPKTWLRDARRLVMTKKARRQDGGPVLLTRLQAFDRDTDDVRVVVDTPKGSSYKFKYNAACGTFDLFAILPEGLAFPHDFGFIPSTRGPDGDPLDVLLLLDHPVAAGCVTTARLAGVFKVRQRKRGSRSNDKWIRNDRFVAVATHSHT